MESPLPQTGNIGGSISRFLELRLRLYHRLQRSKERVFAELVKQEHCYSVLAAFAPA
jgi:hypothetical protein